MLFWDIDYGDDSYINDNKKDKELSDELKYDILNVWKTIKNYEVINNTIIINYENKSQTTIPYSKESEVAILKKMRQQLTDKYKYTDLDDLKSDLKDARFKTILNSIPTVCWGLATTMNLLMSKYVLGAIQGINVIIWGPQAGVNLVKWIKISKKIKEIKKYKLYQSIEGNLGKLNSLNSNITIFNNKKKNEMPINANTYDKFNLKDLKKIKTTIDKISENDFNSDYEKAKRK